MEERRTKDRSMCAELLTIRWMDCSGRRRCEAVILEDISVTGVCLHTADPIAPGTEISMLFPKGKYKGRVKYCNSQEIGHTLGIAFDDGYLWSKALFRPSHLFKVPQTTEICPHTAENAAKPPVKRSVRTRWTNPDDSRVIKARSGR